MAKNKRPAFMFYPKDFLTDSRVMVMSNHAIGAYVKLLCVDWLENGIRLEEFNRLIRLNKLSGKNEEAVRECFGAHPDKEGKVTNGRLSRERIVRIDFENKCSRAGKRSAELRLLKLQEGDINVGSTAVAIGLQPKVNSSSSFAFASSIDLPSEDPPLPPKGGTRGGKPKVELKDQIKFPEAWTVDHRTSFARWIEYRTEIRKPLKAKSLQAQVDHYASDPQKLSALITRTITEGWQGLNEHLPFGPVNLSNGRHKALPDDGVKSIREQLAELKAKGVTQ